MSFSTYFTLLSYLMVTSGLTAAGFTRTIGVIPSSGLVAFTGLGLLLQLSGKRANIPKALGNSLAIAIFILFLIDYLFVTRSLIDVSIRSLTTLMVVKLFDLKTNRDYLILYSLAFFLLLATSATTTNLSFLLVLILYILIGIWTMVVFNLKRDWEESGTAQAIPKGVLSPTFFLATSVLALFSLLITFLLFFIIPRVGVGLFPNREAETIRVTGFSEKVALGELGPIKLDPTIVMRVELPDLRRPPDTPLYFRGMAFDYYDGRGWRQTIKERVTLAGDPQGVFKLTAHSPQLTAHSLRQNILLEPIDVDVVFAASFPVAVSGLPRVDKDRMGAIYLPTPSLSRTGYTAYSIIQGSGNERLPILRGQDSIEPGLDIYTQIPDGMERVVELARMVTNGRDTPLEKAKSIEAMLKADYRYTLNPKDGRGKDPLNDFLFYTKEGYCEQFATAMTILLRGVGVPTRFVTGFLQGEWNRFGNYLLIRQRDAHSWVEVYVEGRGWTIFDPTPSLESADMMPSQTSIIDLYLDSLRWRWNRYIINYTSKDQIKLARAVEGRLSSLLYGGRDIVYRVKGPLLSGKGVTYPLAILLLVSLLLAARKGIIRQKGRATKAPDFYLKMLKVLARRGIERGKGQTPREFASRIAIPGVEEVTILYERVRYAGYRLGEEDLHRVEGILKAISSQRSASLRLQ